eukprot:915863-Pyramimonas_sp.AAC.1
MLWILRAALWILRATVWILRATVWILRAIVWILRARPDDAAEGELVLGMAVDHDLPLHPPGGLARGQHVHQSGLARARGPHQRRQRARQEVARHLPGIPAPEREPRQRRRRESFQLESAGTRYPG